MGHESSAQFTRLGALIKFQLQWKHESSQVQQLPNLCPGPLVEAWRIFDYQEVKARVVAALYVGKKFTQVRNCGIHADKTSVAFR